MEAIREDAIAKVLRPYADNYHPGYMRSLEAEMSERVMGSVGADAHFRRKLKTLYDRGEFATMATQAAKFERRALKRISREIVKTKLHAETSGRFTSWLRTANSLIFGEVDS